MWPEMKLTTSILLFCGYSQSSGCGILSEWGCLMEVNEEKIDNMVLALLYLTTFEETQAGIGTVRT